MKPHYDTSKGQKNPGQQAYILYYLLTDSDVVLETRRLEERNESLGLEEKVLQSFKTFVVILDGSEQGIP